MCDFLFSQVYLLLLCASPQSLFCESIRRNKNQQWHSSLSPCPPFSFNYVIFLSSISSSSPSFPAPHQRTCGVTATGACSLGPVVQSACPTLKTRTRKSSAIAGASTSPRTGKPEDVRTRRGTGTVDVLAGPSATTIASRAFKPESTRGPTRRCAIVKVGCWVQRLVGLGTVLAWRRICRREIGLRVGFCFFL